MNDIISDTWAKLRIYCRYNGCGCMGVCDSVAYYFVTSFDDNIANFINSGSYTYGAVLDT